MINSNLNSESPFTISNHIISHQEYEVGSPMSSSSLSSKSNHSALIDFDNSHDSIDQDHFLQELNEEQKISKMTSPTIDYKNIQQEVEGMFIDKKYIKKILLPSQQCEEIIKFTNPTSSRIKMKILECPFPINSHNRSLHSIQQIQQSTQIILEPFEILELQFILTVSDQSEIDIFEDIAVVRQFIDRKQQLKPLMIRFQLQHTIPHICLKYQGSYYPLSMSSTTLPVIKIKQNKIGQYFFELSINKIMKKSVKLNLEGRGNVASCIDSIKVSEGEARKIYLKKKPNNPMKGKRIEKGIMILKPQNCGICYLFGVQFE